MLIMGQETGRYVLVMFQIRSNNGQSITKVPITVLKQHYYVTYIARAG